MAANDDASNHAGANTSEAAARYRRATEETLNQLDWCVSYLYSIRKPRIAEAVQKNRSAIRRRMLSGDEQ